MHSVIVQSSGDKARTLLEKEAKKTWAEFHWQADIKPWSFFAIFDNARQHFEK